MRTLLRPLVAAAVAAAAFGAAAPANAACAGTAQTIVVCATVNPGALPTVDLNGSSYDDCVYVVNPPCVPVSVPIPTVTPGSGPLVATSCGGKYGQYLNCQLDRS